MSSPPRIKRKPETHVHSRACIAVHGARQNNLKNLDLEIPLQELVVVTGVSGSGKSSLVFDTLYAEGQRRYVETFSPYARQFLDRMDKPAVDRVDGIPPAIAIDQTNPVRTSRSTVGTMTELNDHLKLLFARAATLHCRNCGKVVRRDSAQSVYDEATARAAAAGDPRIYICFPVEVPKNFKEAEVRKLLEGQGYTRVHEHRAHADGGTLEVVQDRLRLGNADRARVMESLEAALRMGRGRVSLHVVGDGDPPASLERWRYSTDLHCADCDIHYRDPVPSLFSFNSPVGACETCRGFGRIIGIDYGLVVPDETKTLAGGAVKPWQTKSYKECQDDLEKFARKRDIPLDTPWYMLSDEQRKWVIEGEGRWEKKVWYGARRFFEWLETKAYKMHVRVLLSRYRAYTPCTACGGSRLKPEALLWRIEGHNVHDLMLMSLDKSRAFFDALRLPAPMDEAADLLLREVRARFAYLCEVGLGYLTLDRQSRTLSGGEVQRINLTTALGTSLVNTLFVLDEPSIGLHPRDMQRVTQVMHRLRDAGNSLVVVEHDPQIMLAADRLLDMGPGAGERGGEIVAFDTPEAISANPRSLTGQYLSGAKQVAPRAAPPPADAAADKEPKARMVPALKAIKLRGVTQHNLKNVDVEFPLRRLVCITGVSGSGKSTLIEDVLYKAMLKAHGKPSEMPGAYERLEGAELVDDVVMVDQSSIGRTTRSNPASYVGAFDVVRELFANEPMAKSRGYTAGTFSFNSGTGRCPTCSGNGFEHVEMQFLSDVYLRCPDCDGTRYRAETLEIRREGATGERKSIADVLNMTVTEALAFFKDKSAVAARLQPLVDVGLEYVKLGQPVPTLSGGEAQRLKLAGHLAEAAVDDTPSVRGKLFLFDEPTTGLHFDDVAKLLRAFRKLLKIGHSLLVIEHNLDVMRAADWIIDLGPEGGDGGGRLVVAGTPAQVEAHAASHTGRALREYGAVPGEGSRGNSGFRSGVRELGTAAARNPELPREPSPGTIHIHNAREHNLRNIDVEIPREAFTVITGVSGSGKSTLAFDIIFNEGQRRYLESLNAYARQFVQPAARPDVDAIFGIPPTVAIEQRTSRGGRKSTVATLTEIYHFLRLLYQKLGTQFCPTCDVPIEPQTASSIAERLLKHHKGSRLLLLAPLVVARKGYYTELAKWANARGYKQLRVDGEMLTTYQWPRLNRFKEHTIELPVAQMHVSKDNADSLERNLVKALDLGKGLVHVLDPDAKKPKVQVFSIKRACPSCGTSFAELDPRLFSFNSKHGWCEACYGTGLELEGFDEEQSGEETAWNEWMDAEGAHVCETCDGQRLNQVALHVRFRDLNIAELTRRAIDDTVAFIGALKLSKRETEIARDLMAEIKARLSFLQRVGLGYLPLDRSAPTLSGGEAQRIRLAAQLGSNLQGVCYVLDEPTIGLHPRDNKVLLDALAQLAKNRNTLVVVEHDEDTIRRADHVIDLGPGAGVRGGEVVAAGTVDELRRNPASITGRFLARPLQHSGEPRRPTPPRAPKLCLDDVELHNIHREDVAIPIGRLVVVTGVSGSGKSTMARDVLYTNLRKLVGQAPRRGSAKPPALAGVAAIRGIEHVDRVLEVDQTPIGKTPRSCPATYIGFWDDIRKIFANTTEAKIAGYTTSRFSFNTAGGRCEACEGQGMQTIEMNFLPDVKVPCDVCRGQRFNRETLSILWRGKSIGDLLAMNIDDAVEFFAAHASIHHALRLLQDVGLGYLTLGQPSPTLSGGEAQRIKLVTELSKVRGEDRRGPRQKAPHTLYVLDEPTVGLHMADVEKLILVLHRLVDAGNSVIVVEHNLDVMAEADWIIDMGPEAGAGGGKVVAAGPPAAVMKVPASHTGRMLAEFLGERRAAG